jgi:hypothetical protein
MVIDKFLGLKALLESLPLGLPFTSKDTPLYSQK